MRYLSKTPANPGVFGVMERRPPWPGAAGVGPEPPAWATPFGRGSVQDECDLKMYAKAGDLPIANEHLLLLDPRTLDIANRLASLRNRIADRSLEALAAGGCQLDRLGNAHGASSSWSDPTRMPSSAARITRLHNYDRQLSVQG